MEGDSGDKVDVLEAAKTFSTRDVPQPDRLVHGRGEEEEVLEHTAHHGHYITHHIMVINPCHSSLIYAYCQKKRCILNVST